MNTKKIHRKIICRKIVLNFLIKFFEPTNKFIVYLSQDLDKLVFRYQARLYNSHKCKSINNSYNKQAC